jgi:hypothetical protein
MSHGDLEKLNDKVFDLSKYTSFTDTVDLIKKLVSTKVIFNEKKNLIKKNKNFLIKHRILTETVLFTSQI